ncbi:MAG: peptidyl-prolyl cis-trans isomerase [Proteobacteria bacterium]|nr:peptidyl-prolyl cis-trans isomerase [Pseudomonadota bacterium]
MKNVLIALLCSLSLNFALTANAAEVEFITNKGVILVKVDEEKAPITAKNFLDYVNEGFFDGLIFHRVIPNFVIQGGGFETQMKRRAVKAPIQNEASNGLKNLKYTLSMARTNDPHSATSQFFINLKDNTNLDPSAASAGYAVFAKVIAGEEVVDAIAKVPTGTHGPFRDVPKEEVIIEKAVVVDGKLE